MNIKKITSSVYYTGVNDFSTYLFEALWPIPFGISYNSYVVKGENIALIDGVSLCQSDNYIQQLKHTIGDQHPKYLIINHMEPDHSGALKILRTIYPHITIVGNRKTLEMINGFYDINTNTLEIKDGDTLNIGGKTLKFIITPMIHWPETMMTYLIEDNLLFSGDAFGSFGALNGGIIDSDIDIENYIPEIYRYYSNILGKYGQFVQKALSKINDFTIDYICPAHGPIWHEEIDLIVSIYNRLSLHKGDPGVVIVYASMYGNTATITDIIASQLSCAGIQDIKIHNAAHSHLSYILSDVFRYKGLIIGSPTYSGSIFPTIEALLLAIKKRGLKNRIVATFGTYSWGKSPVNEMNHILEECNLLDNIPSIEAKYAPNTSIIPQCQCLAYHIANHLHSTSFP